MFVFVFNSLCTVFLLQLRSYVFFSHKASHLAVWRASMCRFIIRVIVIAVKWCSRIGWWYVWSICKSQYSSDVRNKTTEAFRPFVYFVSGSILRFVFKIYVTHASCLNLMVLKSFYTNHIILCFFIFCRQIITALISRTVSY